MWVNDNIIRAAQSLLCDESSDRISGWASTQPCRNRFQEIPIERPFVQIFFVSNNHWITVSNIGSRAGNTVCIYDSMRPSSINYIMDGGLRLQDVVCSFARCAARTLEFAVMNMQAQPNCNDCGLFAVATATALAFNVDPLLCHFDGPRMRTHLKTCLVNSKFTLFPTSKARRVPLGRRVLNTSTIELYCTCRMPWNKVTSPPMILCKECMVWFHGTCVGVERLEEEGFKGTWMCTKCKDDLIHLK